MLVNNAYILQGVLHYKLRIGDDVTFDAGIFLNLKVSSQYCADMFAGN